MPLKAGGGSQHYTAKGSVDGMQNTCSATVSIPLSAPKVLMLELVEKIAASTMIRHTDGEDTRDRNESSREWHWRIYSDPHTKMSKTPTILQRGSVFWPLLRMPDVSDRMLRQNWDSNPGIWIQSPT